MRELGVMNWTPKDAKPTAAVVTADRPTEEPDRKIKKETEARIIELKNQLGKLPSHEQDSLKADFIKAQLVVLNLMDRQDALTYTLKVFKTQYGMNEPVIPNPSWYIPPAEPQSPTNS